MLELAVRLVKSLWYCDFVEVSKCSFAEIVMVQSDHVNDIVNLNMQIMFVNLISVEKRLMICKLFKIFVVGFA